MPDANIYLDANATTRALFPVVDIVASVMRDNYANASSAHWLGGNARAVVERARDGVAALLAGTLPDGVVFTSGGTEGNNAVLSPRGRDAAGTTMIVTAVEHHSVLRPAEAFARAGGQVVIIPVSPEGVLDPADVRDAVLAARGLIILSVQWANGETGVVQPMQDLVAEARRAKQVPVG
jgi:cysteine desulfurase